MNMEFLKTRDKATATKAGGTAKQASPRPKMIHSNVIKISKSQTTVEYTQLYEEEEEEYPLATMPEEYAWMKRGVHVWAKQDNTGAQYPARFTGKPFRSLEAGQDVWRVNVQWEETTRRETVFCCACEQFAKQPTHTAYPLRRPRPPPFPSKRTIQQVLSSDNEKTSIKKKVATYNKSRPPLSSAASASLQFESALTSNTSVLESLPTSPARKRSNKTVAVTCEDNSYKKPAANPKASKIMAHAHDRKDVIVLDCDDDDDDDSVQVAKITLAHPPERNLDVHTEDNDNRVKRTLEGPSSEYQEAVRVLRDGKTRQEAQEALDEMSGPPYCINTALNKIRAKNKNILQPFIGMEIEKPFSGQLFAGKIVSGPIDNGLWKVVYEDGDHEEMDIDDITKWNKNRKRLPAPCLGRPLQCLELFCGRAIVTSAFRERWWKVQAIDIDRNSNATHFKDIMELDPTSDLKFVPDFVWISFPCETHSYLSGNNHRRVKEGQYACSPKALEHDKLFRKVRSIVLWVKNKHPHVIFIIENPFGFLKEMPQMQLLEKELGLEAATVNYCRFGRDESKKTMLWTNDPGLLLRLSHPQYKCNKDTCPYFKDHPGSVRDSSGVDHAAIPELLAELIADYVDAKFKLDNVKRKDPKSVKD